MVRRIFVTLSALLFINAASAGSNVRTIQVAISQPLDLRSAHVFLGIPVLGHHVGRIESGWLVKQASSGYMHIDWSRVGKWDGLVRTQEGPRDVSQSQVDAVVRVIERLGYPAGAIRAWRVPAPVGYDGFGEGDKVLTIGEILVDLGAVDDARLALNRWWDVISKDDDPFDQIPGTNVRYENELYFQPDCTQAAAQLRSIAIDRSGIAAEAAASAEHLTAALSDFTSTTPHNVLCPQDRRPNFYYAGGGPPLRMYDYQLAEMQHASVTYTLSGPPLTQWAAPAADDLDASNRQVEFPLALPYAAAIGDSSVKIKPDAFVLRFTYDLGVKARKGYADDLQQAQARITRLQGLAGAQDLLVQRFSAKESEDRITVYVLVRADKLATIKALMKTGSDGNESDSASHTALVSNCGVAIKTAAARALNESRRKATMLAALVGVKIRALGASRIDDPIGANVICGYDARTPLATLAAQIPPSSALTLNDTLDISAGTTVDAAWILADRSQPKTTLVRTEYRASVRGTAAPDALAERALRQAARQAVVDDPHIVSLYETQATGERGGADGENSASATIVVLRAAASDAHGTYHIRRAAQR